MIDMNERLIQFVMKEEKGLEIKSPFPSITYDDAMSRYGVDIPDTRFDLELQDLSEFSKTSSFKVFKSAVEANGLVKAIVVEGASDKYSRKDIDKLEAFVKNYGARSEERRVGK